jgi:hypothetical protein
MRRLLELIEYWGALRGRLRQVTTVYGEILTVVFNIPDFGRVGINTAFYILYYGIILPASFPEFVTDFKVLIGDRK